MGTTINVLKHRTVTTMTEHTLYKITSEPHFRKFTLSAYEQNIGIWVFFCIFFLSFSPLFAVNIEPHYGRGDSSDRKVVLAKGIIEHALNNIIKPKLGGNIPLLLKVEFLPGDTAGGGAPTLIVYNDGGYYPELFPDAGYSCALASQLTGRDFKKTSGDNSGYHMYVVFNSTKIEDGEFWLEHTKPCPPDKTDFLSTAIHEIGHALGFYHIVQYNGVYPSNMPSIFELNLCGQIGDDFINFELLGPSGRYIVILDGYVWWFGDFIRVVGQRKRSENPYTPGFCSYYYAQMNAPGYHLSSISHWHRDHTNPEQVMEPVLNDALFEESFMAREIGLLGPALQDMGWPDMTLFSAVPTDVHFTSTDTNKGLSSPQTVVVTNNKDVETNVTSIEILGEHANCFAILSGGEPITLSHLEPLYIDIAFSPVSIGYKRAILKISYNDGTQQFVDVKLDGFGITTDTDGDGISDNDETRGLLLGTWNPFNWELADSTGESGSLTGDGVPDGYNDYDGDGMTNAEEFIFGYNPADPESVGNCSSVDTDGDRILDEYEINDPVGIFDPYFADTSGDSGSGEPDGIPDGQNDYDGDGYSNAFEYQWGLNPFEPDYDVPFPASSPLTLFLIVLGILSFGCVCLPRGSRG